MQNWPLLTLLTLSLMGCGGGSSSSGDSTPASSNVEVRTLVVSEGDNCSEGGIQIDLGFDQNQNGILDEDEITSTEYVCNGASSLASTSDVEAGSECVNGGIALSTGIDANSDLQLSEDEVTATRYICDGAAAGSGNDGEEGLTSLLNISSESSGVNCVAGGKKIEHGLDANTDLKLGEDEVSSTTYICDGTDGEDGTDGSNGSDGLTALVKVSSEAAGINCTNGGQRIETGIDANANSILDDSEIEVANTQYICNGVDGSNGEDAAEVLSISINDVTSTEDTASLTFSVGISAAQDSELSFNYGTLDVTAKGGEDYEATAGTLIFAPGETQKDISVNLLNDNSYECNEYFSVQVKGTQGNANAFGIITNDGDSDPELTFTSSESEVNEDAGTATINVSLAAAVCKETTVNVSYINNTTTDSDYTKVDSFVIATGQSSASFSFPIVDDTEKEDREKLTLNLSSSDEISVGLISHQVSIMPVSAKLYEGYYAMCAQTQDGLVKCWGYGGGYQFANFKNDEIATEFGEAGDNVEYACHSAYQPALVSTFSYEPGNGATCDSYGGVGYAFGVDTDSDGILDSGEITNSQDVCNSVTTDNLVRGPIELTNTYNCEHGGYALYHGYDQNSDGQLTITDMGEELIVSDLGDDAVLDLGIGEGHACGLFYNDDTSEKEIKCWGSNSSGYLGLGVDTATQRYAGKEASELGNNLVAVNLGTDKTPAQLAVGDYHTCALLDSGEVKCWGSNGSGQLGYGDNTSRGGSAATIGDNLLAVDLGKDAEGLDYTATYISAGQYHTCAVLNNGKVKCWGDNDASKLGYEDSEGRGDDSNEMGDNLPTVNLGTDRTATAVYAGYDHTCAVLDNGALKCWGRNGDGQVGQASGDSTYGNGGIENSYPKCSTGNTDTQKMLGLVEDIAEGADSCDHGGKYLRYGLDDDGNGSLSAGEYDGAYKKCAIADLNIAALATPFVSGGDNCSSYGGIRLDYGYDHGDNGTFDSEMGDALPAIDLGSDAAIVDISMGYYNTCVVLVDGTFKCWGDGSYGSIGLDLDEAYGDEPGETPANAPSPDMGTDRKAVNFGGRGYQTCALLDNADIKCWGYSEYGELGVPEFYDEYLGDGDPRTEMGDKLPAVKLY